MGSVRRDVARPDAVLGAGGTPIYGQQLAWIVPLVFVAALAVTGWALLRGTSDRLPIVASSVTIAALIAILGQALYPALVPDRTASAATTVATAASSDLALTVMLIIVLIGMPLVVAYTAFVYRRFSHKVTDSGSQSAYG